MGHTLVASLAAADQRRIAMALAAAGLTAPNKIPLDRDCDREAANRILPWHATLAHWGRDEDALYLPRAERLRFATCALVGTGLILDEADGLLLLRVRTGAGFAALCAEVERTIGLSASPFLHVTLAAEADREKLGSVWKQLRASDSLLAQLRVDAMELYHIWRPVRLVREWT